MDDGVGLAMVTIGRRHCQQRKLNHVQIIRLKNWNSQKELLKLGSQFTDMFTLYSSTYSTIP